MQGLKMCWNLAIQLLLFILTLSNSTEARNVKQLHSPAVIVGRVYCDTCFQDDFSRSSHFISGAAVSVECKDASFKTEAKTDDQGKFKVHLPFSISKHEKELKGCRVTLIRSSDPYCSVASTATSSSIHLKARKQGIRVFSAGFFTFKPLKQPDLCNQQSSSIKTSKTRKGLESITRPQALFPPILPSPPPAISIPLPPNPLQPAPLLPLPPNPLQPPSTPASPALQLPPGLPIPPLPSLPIPPIIPGVPSLPIPPVVPGIPSLPIPPVVPGIPSLPIPPVVPGVPGVPSLPIPLPPGLPIPPVIPGVPPARKVSP